MRRDAARICPRAFDESCLLSIHAGSQGSRRSESRRPIKAMTEPKKVESPGSGIGWQNGIDKIIRSSVYARPFITLIKSRKLIGCSVSMDNKLSISSESRRGGTGIFVTLAGFMGGSLMRWKA